MAETGGDERKLVTVVFCDLVESTALGERLDPEAVRAIQSAYFDRMRTLVDGHGGTVEKFIGDAVVAVFGIPRIHEDDAERAVRCALAMRDALGGLNDSVRQELDLNLSLRIGIATGEAITSGSGDQAIATGDVTNTAARVEQSASPGEILVGRETFRLTAGVVDYDERPAVSAKGKVRPVAVWAARRLSLAARRRPRSPLTGREAELETLLGTLEKAIATNAPQFVMVLGEPGIGKSRLAEEFSARTGHRARVLRGAALPYGEGTAWRPVADLVRAEAGILEGEPSEAALPKLKHRLAGRHSADEASLIGSQIGPLLGASRAFGTSESEILWALGRYLEGLSRTGPAVVILDDLHWGDRVLLETIQGLTESMTSGRLMVVLLGRPELGEALTRLGERGQILFLGPLAERDALVLVGRIREAMGMIWSEGEEREIARRAGGNPLFLEEIGAIFQDIGSLERPHTLHALIAARIDLLPAKTKRVVQASAVVGDVFWDGAVASLIDGDPLTEGLRTLRVRGFLDEDEETAFPGNRQLRFHHNLIREVAYNSLPKTERSRMHRKVAGWLESRALDRPDLWVGIAHHLDRAVSLGAEVAVFEKPDSGLPNATANAYVRAAEWTSSNAALPEAVVMLRRATQLAHSGELEALSRARLAHTLAETGAVDEAMEHARAVMVGPAPAEARALASLAVARSAYDQGKLDGLGELAQKALDLARRASLPKLEARALELLAWHELWRDVTTLESFRRAERLLRQAAEVATRIGDLILAARLTATLATFTATVSIELNRAQHLAEEAMRLARSSGSVTALQFPHISMGFVLLYQDRLREAISHGRQLLSLASETGEKVEAIAATVFILARPLRLLGRLEEALSALEHGRSLAREVPSSAYEPNLWIERARVLLALGRIEEADRDLTGVRLDDHSDWLVWTSALAEVRAAQGRDDDAEAMWREALDRPWGDLKVAATEAALGLSRFLALRGRDREARSLLDRARAWLKGTPVPLLERQIREVEAELAPA